jgi:hypothetical protein
MSIYTRILLLYVCVYVCKDKIFIIPGTKLFDISNHVICAGPQHFYFFSVECTCFVYIPHHRVNDGTT